ncbi:MAG: hypothetical protein IANPNBLG_04147 [Bryobacteraceae bacterium]|nr:hypothetical protein [Bryobacteraceae bacterium]
MQNGIVFCRIHSWLTGRRLVSLPFSDHCAPLADREVDLEAILSSIVHQTRRDRLRYAELRPLHQPAVFDALFLPDTEFCFHQLDLTPSLDTLFRNCHKDSVQRKIRRAEREHLACREGGSELLDAFFHLLVQTRRRHHLPPQPKRWFQNLIDCLASDLRIRVAFQDRQPAAAILTLRHKDTLVYKYGASDPRFHPLGAMHLLFWKSIQEAKQDNLRIFDFGRSDSGNTGLLTFKDRWGAKRSPLTYSRFSIAPAPLSSAWKQQIAARIFSRLPDRLLCSAGNLLYKHLG